MRAIPSPQKSPTKLVRGGKIILAFDIGIKNMAYCLLRVGKGLDHLTCCSGETHLEVLDMDKFTIGEWGTAQPKLVQTLCQTLSNRNFYKPDVVVIENQLAHSSTMRILQFALQSYFLGRWEDMEVRFQDGDCKLKLCNTDEIKAEKKAGKNKYRVNKKFALAQAKEELKCTVWSAFLDDKKKGDDLADAYLHGAFYARFRL